MPAANDIIWLQQAAPPKPPYGTPCNGCGICCASTPCPMAHLFLRQRHGTCRALTWNDNAKRYDCGLVTDPARWLPWLHWLPQRLTPAFSRWTKKKIAAGSYCDSLVETQELC